MEPKCLNMTPDLPRADYPRPQWKRENWLSLNGEWKFAFDFGNSGKERGMIKGGDYPLTIRVPFCPESRLSGIGYTDFIPAVWYQKTLFMEKLPEGRSLLHFGAVDYEAEVYVNGVLCATHKGGYASFTADITGALKEGENLLTVYARDDLRSGKQPFGKQSERYQSYACSYTRTTGIWQSVWLEEVPQAYLEHSRMIPHAADYALEVGLFGCGIQPGMTVELIARYEGRPVGSTFAHFSGQKATAWLKVGEMHLWNPGDPAIYDLELTLFDREGEVIDRVESYFAMRDVALTDRALTINGRPVFMRTVLDQGFNPEGIYTAPDDDFIKRDIELSMSMGFNGARFHQRVFEDRSLYWADKLGYLVWAEYANGHEDRSMEDLKNFLPEWVETLEHEFNHPSIIGWCPLNETYHAHVLDPETHRTLYRVTKAMDPSRPVIDASGGMHYDTDLFDVHDYEQDPETYAAYFEGMKDDPEAFHCPISRYLGMEVPPRPIEYKGQPYWVSEYGGTFWNPDIKPGEAGWGYGDGPKTEEEFARRYEGLTDVLLSHPRICGFCYTQLTDIEQEQNGLLRYDRTPKFSSFVYERIRRANMTPAAVERED